MTGDKIFQIVTRHVVVLSLALEGFTLRVQEIGRRDGPDRYGVRQDQNSSVPFHTIG
jgi:hypothetical protein